MIEERMLTRCAELAGWWFMAMQATTAALALVIWLIIEVIAPAIAEVVEEETEGDK